MNLRTFIVFLMIRLMKKKPKKIKKENKMNMTYQNAVKYIDALEKINVAKIDLKNQFGHGMNITSLDDFPNPDKFDRKEGDEFLEKL